MEPKVLYGLLKIKYVDIINDQGLQVQKKKNIGRYMENGVVKKFTFDELIEFIGVDKYEKVFNWEDNEYEPLFFSQDMEEILKDIDKFNMEHIRNKQEFLEVKFLGQVRIGMEYAFSPITGKKYETPHFFMDWNGVKASCGGINLAGIKKEFKDKIRRHFNYNDPYKLKVTEDYFID